MSTVSIFCFAALVALPPTSPSNRVQPGEQMQMRGTMLLPAMFTLSIAGMIFHRLTLVLSISLAVATVCWAVVARQKAARRRSTRIHVSTYLGYIVAALKAGSTLPDAFDRAQTHVHAPHPLGEEFSRLAAQTRAGGDGAKILSESEVEELRDVGALWGLSSRLGIPVADLLDSARSRLDHQQRHAEATAAALSGPKATAVVLSVLPLAGVLMGQAMGASPLTLLTGGGLGGVLLLVGTALVCAGFATSQHIIGRATCS